MITSKKISRRLIVFTSGMYPFQTHGAEVGAYYLAKELLKQGYRVSVYLSESVDKDVSVEALELPDGLKVVYPSGNHLRVLYNLLYLLKSLQRVSREPDRALVTLVNIPTLLSLTSAFIVKRFIGIPYLVIIHGPSDLIRSPRLVRWIQCELVRRAAGVVCVSRDLAKVLLSDCPFSSTPTVIPNGYDETEIQKTVSLIGKNVSSKQIAFVGALDSNKDPLTLLRSFKIVADEDSTVILHIVGDGPLTESVRQLSREEGITNRIVLRSSMAHSEVLKSLAESNLLVLTSRREGTPTVVIEALALGKPVVATDTGGLPEIIRNGTNGFLVSVGDTVAIAQRILQILDDEKLRERLSKDAASSVKDYKWSRIAKRYSELIELITSQD